jgi:hypothetical protein
MGITWPMHVPLVIDELDMVMSGKPTMLGLEYNSYKHM